MRGVYLFVAYLSPNDLEPESLLVSILPWEHELLIPIVKCFLNGNIMVYHVSCLASVTDYIWWSGSLCVMTECPVMVRWVWTHWCWEQDCMCWHILINSAGIWSILSDLCLFSFSIAISTSKTLCSGTSGSAVCISVCLTSLTPCTLNC